MSASVAVSPSLLKSAEPQVGQQLPARQAKKASMSASVAESPSLSKSAVQLGEQACSSAMLWERMPLARVKLPVAKMEREPSALWVAAMEVMGPLADHCGRVCQAEPFQKWRALPAAHQSWGPAPTFRVRRSLGGGGGRQAGGGR